MTVHEVRQLNRNCRRGLPPVRHQQHLGRQRQRRPPGCDLAAVGDRVEARYGGKSQWFSGEISRENSDGTFAIKYDDGDRELRVRSNLIRKKGGVGGGKKKSGYQGSDSPVWNQ